jgi:glycine/serine hydroxymethyltransferase
MGPAEMKRIAALIDRALKTAGDTNVAAEIRGDVEKLAKEFPLYS